MKLGNNNIKKWMETSIPYGGTGSIEVIQILNQQLKLGNLLVEICADEDNDGMFAVKIKNTDYYIKTFNTYENAEKYLNDGKFIITHD